MTSLLILNVTLFLAAALVGAGMCAFGWKLAGHSDEEGGNGGGGGGGGAKVVAPIEPLPVAPLATIQRRDLARSA